MEVDTEAENLEVLGNLEDRELEVLEAMDQDDFENLVGTKEMAYSSEFQRVSWAEWILSLRLANRI